MRRFGEWKRAFAVFVGLALLAACEREQAVDPSKHEPPSETTAEIPVPVPEGEPPADVVRALMFEEYEDLEKLGGMPATVSASGKQLLLRAKLFEATKDECRPRPQRPAGEFECWSGGLELDDLGAFALRWLGGEDSNPQRLDQNQLCYRLHHPRTGGR